MRGGKAFAGGLPVPTPFGTIYSSNITPDPETGIGRWPEAAFRRAMRSGVDRDGRHLYPTFPYDHFTNVSDDDDRALYAYLMTRQPVHAPARANQLPFPLDQRFVIAGWKLLFLRPGPTSRTLAQSAEWNRGAYLVEGPGALRRLPHAAQCARRRNERARRLPAATSITGMPMRSTPSRRRRCRGTPMHCSSICATAGIPITAWRADRWRRSSSNLSSVPESEVRAIADLYGRLFGAPTPDRKRRGDEVLAPAKSPCRHQPACDRRGRRIDLRRGVRDLP